MGFQKANEFVCKHSTANGNMPRLPVQRYRVERPHVDEDTIFQMTHGGRDTVVAGSWGKRDSYLPSILDGLYNIRLTSWSYGCQVRLCGWISIQPLFVSYSWESMQSYRTLILGKSQVGVLELV